MKLLSPTLFEAKELINHNKCHTGDSTGMDTMKYIAVYRSSLRNSNGINSSRSDLIIQEKTNEYDNNYIKNNYGVELKKKNKEQEVDLVMTDCTHKNNSAREYMKIHAPASQEARIDQIELPKIMASSPYQKAVSYRF